MMDVNPEIYLRGENLEYYRNIEYLKEITKQATALISRSNAVYNNILMDDHIGVKARGLSISEDNRSISPDYGRCEYCGLFHGCAAFCIVRQIMAEEETTEKPEEKNSSRTSPKQLTVGSKGTEGRRMPFEQQLKQPAWKALSIDAKMSPEEVFQTYEMICTRYGPPVGQRFLKVRKMIDSPKQEIEPWTSRSSIISHQNKKYQRIRRTCAQKMEEVNYLCPGRSPSICQELEKLVELLPPCSSVGYKPEKRWRDVLKSSQPSKKRANPTIVHIERNSEPEMEERPELTQCACGIPNCFCGKTVKCEVAPVKKECHVDHDSTNNHLLNMRRKIERRRATKTRRYTEAVSKTNSDISRQQSAPLVNQYLKSAQTDQINSLCQCLGSCIPVNFNQDDFDEFYNKVTEVAQILPLQIWDDEQWGQWQQHYKKLDAQELGEDGDGDSMGSDMLSEESDQSNLTNSWNIDYRTGKKVAPTRIPYAQEVYDKLENLFDKIETKFAKTLKVNRFNKEFSKETTGSVDQFASVATATDRNSSLRELLWIMKQDTRYSKMFYPLHARKVAKLKRLQARQKKNKRTQARREVIYGIQQGKKYRPKRKPHRYSAEGGFTGFERSARELLQRTPSFQRFATCDLVGDGRFALTKKKLNHDYRLISKLFDVKSFSRETMMDEGMRFRLEKYKEYGRKFQEALEETELEQEHGEVSDCEDEVRRTIPSKEEAQLVQASIRQQSMLSGESNMYKRIRKPTVSGKNATRVGRKSAPGKSDSQNKCSTWLENSPLESHGAELQNMCQKSVGLESTNNCKLSPSAIIEAPFFSNTSKRNDVFDDSPIKMCSSRSVSNGVPLPRKLPERKSHGNNLDDYKMILRRYQDLTLPPPPRSDMNEDLVVDHELCSVGLRRPAKEEEKVVGSSQGGQTFRSTRELESSSKVKNSGLLAASTRTNNELIYQGTEEAARKTSFPRNYPTRQPGKLSVLASDSSRQVEGLGDSSLRTAAILAAPTWTTESPLSQTTGQQRTSRATLEEIRPSYHSLRSTPSKLSSTVKWSQIVNTGGAKADKSPPVLPPSAQRIQSPSHHSDAPSTTSTGGTVTTKEDKMRPQERQSSNSYISFRTIPGVEKMRAGNALDMLGPTKKRSFGVDIGQGISYVQYLKANAVDADSQKKGDLVNIMCFPSKKKKHQPPILPKIQEASTSQLRSFSGVRSRSESERLFSELNKEEKKTQKGVTKVVDVESNAGHPYRFSFKTLDEIFKEAHGINERNTPKALIENDYEHEAIKKQQLKKHRGIEEFT